MAEYQGAIGFSEDIDLPFRKIAPGRANPLVIPYFTLMHDFIACRIDKLYQIEFMDISHYFDERPIDKTEAANVHRQFFRKSGMFFAFVFAHSEQIQCLLEDSAATAAHFVGDALERENAPSAFVISRLCADDAVFNRFTKSLLITVCLTRQQSAYPWIAGHHLD